MELVQGAKQVTRGHRARSCSTCGETWGVVSLTRVQEVVGGHLERFAANEGLHLVWQRVQPSP